MPVILRIVSAYTFLLQNKKHYLSSVLINQLYLASGVKDALPYLQIAEEDYRLLEIYPSVQDVIYVTALVYNILGDEKARDEAAKRHEVAGADVERTDTMDVSKYWPEIWEFAGEVCARLTFRGDS